MLLPECFHYHAVISLYQVCTSSSLHCLWFYAKLLRYSSKNNVPRFGSLLCVTGYVIRITWNLFSECLCGWKKYLDIHTVLQNVLHCQLSHNALIIQRHHNGAFIVITPRVNLIIVLQKVIWSFFVVDQYVLSNFEPRSYEECGTACETFGPSFSGRLVAQNRVCNCDLCREDFLRIALDPLKEKDFLKYTGCKTMEMIRNVAPAHYPLALYVCKGYL